MGNVNCNCIKIENNAKGDNVFKTNDIVFENLNMQSTEEIHTMQINSNSKVLNVKSKINNTKNVIEEIECPGVELQEDQNLNRGNKYVEMTENIIGAFSIDKLENLENFKLTTHSILYPDNTIYIGTYNDNWQREGFGTLYMTDGCKYTGEFREDKMNGKGRIIYATGDYYEGDFVDDKPNGEGIFVKTTDGVTYKGSWKDETKSGFGVEINKDGSKYEGNHEEDMKHGKGKFTWADGTVYEGTFICNDIEGFGKIVYPDMKIYLGEWKLNKIEGKGIFYWPDGKCYIGFYKQDRKNNFGLFLFCDGKKYEGFWLDGKQHGFGLCSFKGTTRLGEWRFGKKIRWITEKMGESEFKPIVESIIKNSEEIYDFCKKLHIENIEDPQLKEKLLSFKL